MTDSNISTTRRDATAGAQDLQVHPDDPSEAQRNLTSEQILRWAKLVADGQEPFPTGLNPVQEEQMLRQVRRHRCLGLVKHIARQIASDIVGIGGPRGGNNVET